MAAGGGVHAEERLHVRDRAHALSSGMARYRGRMICRNRTVVATKGSLPQRTSTSVKQELQVCYTSPVRQPPVRGSAAKHGSSSIFSKPRHTLSTSALTRLSPTRAQGAPSQHRPRQHLRNLPPTHHVRARTRAPWYTHSTHETT